MKKFRLKSISILMASAIMLSACGSAGADDTAAETAETAEEAVEISEEVTSSNTPSDVDNTDIEEQDATEAIEAEETETEEAEIEPYQFSAGGFQFNVPDEYEVDYIFADYYPDGTINTNSLALSQDDFHFMMDFYEGDKFLSIYAQEDVSFADFDDTDDSVSSEAYGVLPIKSYTDKYTISSIYNMSGELDFHANIDSQLMYEAVYISDFSRLVLVSYEANEYKGILTDLLSNMLEENVESVEAIVYPVSGGSEIAVNKDDYDYIVQSNDIPVYAFNLPEDIGAGGEPGKEYGLITVGNYYHSDWDDKEKVASVLSIGSGVYNDYYLYKGNTFYTSFERTASHITSIEAIDEIDTYFGMLTVYKIKYNGCFTSGDEVYINTHEEILGVINNNGESVVFTLAFQENKDYFDEFKSYIEAIESAS